MSTVSPLGDKIKFLFEAWNKPYIQYDEVNTGKENLILAQEFLQSSLLCKLAGKNGGEL